MWDLLPLNGVGTVVRLKWRSGLWVEEGRNLVLRGCGGEDEGTEGKSGVWNERTGSQGSGSTFTTTL